MASARQVPTGAGLPPQRLPVLEWVKHPEPRLSQLHQEVTRVDFSHQTRYRAPRTPLVEPRKRRPNHPDEWVASLSRRRRLVKDPVDSISVQTSRFEHPDRPAGSAEQMRRFARLEAVGTAPLYARIAD